MKHRTLPAAILILCVVGSVNAQSKVSKQRLDAIWSALDDRVTQQSDVWFEEGDFPKSIHILEMQATYSPHDYEVVTNLGWMQENVEEWDTALATYKTYLRNNPQDKDRALPEATYLFNRRRYAEVPPVLEPVIAGKPHPNNYRLLAHAYEKLKKYKDAKRIWVALIARDPRDLMAVANLKKVEKKLSQSK